MTDAAPKDSQKDDGGAEGPTVHCLKTWPEYFRALLDGSKTFEVRKADRDFRVGDTLRLREFDPHRGWHDGEYTGREMSRTVTYILGEDSPFAFPGFVVMGLSRAATSESGAGEWGGEVTPNEPEAYDAMMNDRDYWKQRAEAALDALARIGAELCVASDSPSLAEGVRLAAHAHRVELRMAEAERDALRQAITRGALDLYPCRVCGLTVACIPDGLPFCEDCAAKEAKP